jgi:hypothetical protein
MSLQNRTVADPKDCLGGSSVELFRNQLLNLQLAGSCEFHYHCNLAFPSLKQLLTFRAFGLCDDLSRGQGQTHFCSEEAPVEARAGLQGRAAARRLREKGPRRF